MKNAIGKALIIALLLVVMALYAGCHYIFYGSVTSNCTYTEESLPIPEQISKGTLIVTKGAYLGIGRDPETRCLRNLGGIDRQILNTDIIHNGTVGERYYTEKGLSVEPLKLGTTFRVIGMQSVRKRGLTIDSGSGPWLHLILEDQDGLRYRIATSMLGINDRDLFLTYTEPGQPRDMLLSPYYFKYTGEFITAPKSYYNQQPVAEEWMTP